MGPRTFLTVQNFHWYNCSAVCGSFAWQLYGGLMIISSKRAYATGYVTQGAAPRAPAPAAGHCWPVPLQETLKHSSGSVSGSWCAHGLFEPSKHLWQVWGLILKTISPFVPSCWGFSFALGCEVSFFGGLQYSPVDGCSAASCNFGVLAGEDECTSFYSAIFILCLTQWNCKPCYAGPPKMDGS